METRRKGERGKVIRGEERTKKGAERMVVMESERKGERVDGGGRETQL